MIHQPLGGTQGQATDMEIEVEHMLRIKKNLISIMAENAGKDYEVVLADCERNKWLTADEALEYGLIDQVIKSR
jgi:ATP-dependent Clp protease protease subunit